MYGSYLDWELVSTSFAEHPQIPHWTEYGRAGLEWDLQALGSVFWCISDLYIII